MGWLLLLSGWGYKLARCLPIDMSAALTASLECNLSTVRCSCFKLCPTSTIQIERAIDKDFDRR